MLRRMMVMNDGSLLTIKHQQHHAQILPKIEIKERVFKVFVKYLCDLCDLCEKQISARNKKIKLALGSPLRGGVREGLKI